VGDLNGCWHAVFGSFRFGLAIEVGLGFWWGQSFEVCEINFEKQELSEEPSRLYRRWTRVRRKFNEVDLSQLSYRTRRA
jgi:hypothetical protein